ncbi:WxL protein peptidoglycan domain-containing protein [Micromonospora sp. NPDC092111]|uniref:WxL protein peptidoglycan domain-containing protein n=1 Tax=Micromonospora sp. NPDC092111 TaxID=3364289 RepID=UPI0038282A14
MDHRSSRPGRVGALLTAVLVGGLVVAGPAASAAPPVSSAVSSAAGTTVVRSAVPAPVTAGPGARTGAADGELRWSVQPAAPKGTVGRNLFEYQSGAGTRVADRVTISNLSDRPLTFAVYATDAYSAPDGAFALLPASDRPTGLGSWIRLPRREYTVPTGKRLEIPFELSVPAKATPGDHAGGIVASIVERQTDPQGQLVNVDRRVAARVYLRVEGELAPEVRIERLATSYRTPAVPFASGDFGVRYRVRNTGNVRMVAGQAALRVRGPLGFTLADAGRVALPELLPGGEIVLDRELKVWPAGRLDAVVTVNPVTAEGRLPATSRSAGTWAAPWSVIGTLLIVLALAALGLLARRRRRALDDEPTSAPVTALAG